MEIGVGVVICSKKENSSFQNVSRAVTRCSRRSRRRVCFTIYKLDLSSSILYRHLTNARRGRGGYLSNSPFASSRTRFERSTDRP